MQLQRLSCAAVISCLALVAGLVVLNRASSAQDDPGRGTYIDGHLHFSNQVAAPQKPRGPLFGGGRRQGNRTPGEFSESDFVKCADNMIALMDRYGVQKALVMPQPRLSGQPGFYDYKQILPAVRKYPGRLILGGGGGDLNSMIHATDPSRVTDDVRARFKQEALAVLKDGAKVFGEMAALHVSLNPHHVYEEAAPDHPLFLLLADIAAEHNIPIDIHMEAVVKDTPTPANLRKISTKNPEIIKANIPAFERLLQHNRKAKIVWQHIGWDNVGHMTIALLRRMATDHPNLYMGFKIEERPVQVGTREPMPNRMVDGDGKIKPEWVQFFKDFPDRLLVCTDQFVGIPGTTTRPPQSFDETWTAIKQLPSDVMLKVGRDNAATVYGLR
ncbi:MAG: amidohydrolase family protein [Planctomycetota bacterium]